MSALRAFRVGVVGARRVRQGVGEHLARFCHEAGTKVVAVAGRTGPSSAEAADALRARCGIEATPYDDVGRMVGEARLDALVIASPDETHEACLGAALEAGLHVLCEKPLLPPDPGSAERGERLLAAFAARGLCLALNTPWRFALAAWMQLFPEGAPRRARRFAMELSPGVEGGAMCANSLPHPLSLLDHLHPDAEPGLTRLLVEQPDPRQATVRFLHPGLGGIACEVRLATVHASPRPAALAFDGRWARRVVEGPTYRWSLEADGEPARRVPLPDPMETLVRRFVARVRKGGPFPPEPGLRAGLRHLEQLAGAWPA